MTSQRILIWRKWEPQYAHPLTYSALENHSVGGTESQMLWHASNLVQMGHQVQVLGASECDIVEEGVDFVGSQNRSHQEQLMASGRVKPPSLIMLEGDFVSAPVFRTWYPSASLVHIGHNIDELSGRAALSFSPWIDYYVFLSPGHLSHYCERFPRMRHKFVLVRNIVPWHRLYNSIRPSPVENEIAWVGSWGKQGLRCWLETMQRILAEHQEYAWTLYGPQYGRHPPRVPDYLVWGTSLPPGRISFQSLPMMGLMHRLASARIVLVSLGGECCPMSTLDTHAAGRPVISGNDMVYQFINPEGTGFRVSSPQQCYEAVKCLLGQPELCNKMGALGRKLVLSDYTETNQQADLSRLLDLVALRSTYGKLLAYPAQTARAAAWGRCRDKVFRQYLKCRAKIAARRLRPLNPQSG